MACKNRRKLLSSGVIFPVKFNKYECFMGNKNILRTFCGCKASSKKKKNIEPHQNFTGSYKQMVMDGRQDRQNIKRYKDK